MSKRITFIFLLLLASMLSFAASNLYYGALRAESVPQAGGRVYAGATNRTDTLATAMTSGLLSTETMEGEVLAYAYAQPNEGYSFLGWSNTPSGTIAHTENPLAIAVRCLAKNSSAPTTDTIFAQFRELQSVSVTLAPPTMLDGAVSGSYTADYSDGSSFTVSTSAQQKSTYGTVTLTAQPATGTKFFGWQRETTNGTEYITYEDTLRDYGFHEDCTIRAVFCDANAPLWEIKGQFGRYADLGEAITQSVLLRAQLPTSHSAIVALVSSGTLHGQHTIADSVCLLIPFDKQQSCYREKPGIAHVYTDGWTHPAEYRRLTMASDASLVVHGELSVSAKMMASPGGAESGCGNVWRDYGCIDMQAGSQILLQDSAKLYCWGFITGEGEITAADSSRVYEGFQMPKMRGGSVINTMAGNRKHVFQVNQYYIQNVEAPLSLHSGATLQIFTSVKIDDDIYNATAPYIGQTGLYQPADGTVIRKRYDPLTDRQIYDIQGDAEFAQMQLSIAGYLVNSEVYVMPITNNMDIRVHEGTTTVDHQLALLAGATLQIDSNAAVRLTDSTYIYDRDEWLMRKFEFGAYIRPAVYSPTRQCERDTASLRDAILDVNGTLIVDSVLYTTKGGANICSTQGTGRIIFNKVSPAADTTYQVTQDSMGVLYHQVPCTAPLLRNAERYAHCAEYLSTIGIQRGDTIYNHNGHWGWMRSWEDADADANSNSNADANSNVNQQVYACFCALSEEALPDSLLPADFVPEKLNSEGDTCTFIQWTTERDAAMQQIVTTAEWNCPDGPDNPPVDPPVEDAIEEVAISDQPSAVSKYFRDGQIIIRRDEEEYNVLGVRL